MLKKRREARSSPHASVSERRLRLARRRPGQFYIRDKLTNFNNPFYGPIAFGTSARSAVLTDWPGGGFVGVHGTNEPDLIPGYISHGCIRLRQQRDPEAREADARSAPR